jgi:hypothetical protein
VHISPDFGWITLLTLKDESRLRVLANMVLRKIFGAKRKGVKWRMGETV